MKLYELNDLIKRIALVQPNIREYHYGDIYEKMNRRRDIKYASVVLTHQSTRTVDEYTKQHTMNLFYVDRMLEDESNKVEIQSQAQEVLSTIIDGIETAGYEVLDPYEFINFTQRFADLCAGCYATFTVEVPLQDCTGEEIGLVTSINGKSGEVHLKTINGESIIGVGDIEISGGTGGGITSAQCQTMIDNSLDDYYTKEEANDAIYAATSGIPSSQTIEQLRTDVNTISGDVESLETEIADTYSKDEVDAALDTKADNTGMTSIYQAVTAHTSNSGIHVSASEKAQWNNGISGVTFNNQQATVSNHVASITASIPTITYDPNTKILTITN